MAKLTPEKASMLSPASEKREHQAGVCFGWEQREVGFPLAWGLAGDAVTSLQTPAYTYTHTSTYTRPHLCTHSLSQEDDVEIMGGKGNESCKQI